MLVSEQLLISYGAEHKAYKPNEIIFNESDVPRYFYQIIYGRVKLNHYNEEGKELILAVLDKGLSVCELLLFIDKTYPVNAIVLEQTEILRLPKTTFNRMLDEHVHVARDINKYLAERLYYKFLMLESNSSLLPEVRLKGILDYQKSFSLNDKLYSFEVPLTRQQLAAMTSLRVETVIRTIKNLESQNDLRIINGKIFY